MCVYVCVLYRGASCLFHTQTCAHTHIIHFSYISTDPPTHPHPQTCARHTHTGEVRMESAAARAGAAA